MFIKEKELNPWLFEIFVSYDKKKKKTKLASLLTVKVFFLSSHCKFTTNTVITMVPTMHIRKKRLQRS